MTVRDRALWLVVLCLLIFVAVTGQLVLQVNSVQRQQDRDMCDLTAAILSPDAPTPSPGTYGAGVRNGVTRYRTSRCH